MPWVLSMGYERSLDASKLTWAMGLRQSMGVITVMNCYRANCNGVRTYRSRVFILQRQKMIDCVTR